MYRWHLARANSERNANGAVVKWFGTNTDIHDQKLAEDALRQSEEQFRSIVETTSEWIWAVDLAGALIKEPREDFSYLGGQLILDLDTNA